ncbi:hypothetical protein PSEUBRA_003628 [Kalmanozyma brasiliensis GHG001]|uniref:uncharacterized protein n=1 Tax=Kalmanozyma brasiliensis (strain GHG001) TaxID=1365824 RepID=UPI0028683397|nr:uncharacterized protein PSEUBRA_003628 [Kalmanozyma brasiliensis GHG001]KAF6767266.1 hypothetical protein PSEUBRA_003628 [Kalmanozyma brasiliensis GHG001]
MEPAGEVTIIKAILSQEFAALPVSLVSLKLKTGFKRIEWNDDSLAAALLRNRWDDSVNFSAFFQCPAETEQHLAEVIRRTYGYEGVQYVTASTTTTSDCVAEPGDSQATYRSPSREATLEDPQTIPHPPAATALPDATTVQFSPDAWSQYVGPRNRTAVRMPERAAFLSRWRHRPRHDGETYNIIGTIDRISPFAIKEDSVKLWQLRFDEGYAVYCWLFALPTSTRSERHELQGLKPGDVIACFNVKGSLGGALITNESEIFVAVNEAEGRRCVAEANPAEADP